jgi:hypothetical protein
MTGPITTFPPITEPPPTGGTAVAPGPGSVAVLSPVTEIPPIPGISQSIPGVTFQFATLTVAQTFTALQNFAAGLTSATYNGLSISSGAGLTLTITNNSTLSGTNTGDQTITLTGNVTGSGTGSFATTIAAGAVTNAMLAGSIDLTTKVTGLLPAADFPALTGDVTTAGGTLATSIATNAVTNAKLATVANQTLKANISGGTAAPSDSTLTAILDNIMGSTRGQIITRGAATWSALALGTNAQVLTSNGTDAIWAAGGGGTGTESIFLHAAQGGI